MLRSHVLLAVFRRNVASYFSGVLGYLVIVVFVVVGAFLAFSPQFFTNNLANLDQLSDKFPLLLLFLVPAITMGAWADEKKLGTEELLFTLPASDVEILLGKYLAVLFVYTAALGFSLTHLIVLAKIGDPDWGMIFTTYLGYWLSGAALLSAGMFASVLTNSTTVAFVLGATICAIPVFIGKLANSDIFQTLGLSEFVLGLGLSEQTRDFGLGMIPISGVVYFVSLTLLMLYLNLVFISRRHWGGSQQTNMGMHFFARTLCVAATLVSIGYSAVKAGFDSDMTAENLYSLSGTTRGLIGKIDKKRPVTIQAFLSPNVPREYVPVRKRLIGLLRQYNRLGGSRIEVRMIDVEPSSIQSDEAKTFGIEPVRVATERDGRRISENVYLGAVVTSSFDEVVIPFLGAGTPIEYELTRSIRTVSNEKRLTVGVLKTDANVISYSDGWRIVTELKQQYNVKEVSPDSPIDPENYDVVIAVLPSSLTQNQMENLVDYVQGGHPVLIFDDPCPLVFRTMFGISNAPRQPKPRPGGMFGGMRGQQPEPKADGGKATSLLRALKIAWDNGQVVFNPFNPHPEFGDIPPEYLFIAPRKNIRSAFSQKSEITSDLQEMLLAYSGHVRPVSGNDDVKFEPLLRTGADSGLLDWDDFTETGFDPSRGQMTARLMPSPLRIMDDDAHVLAARITSDKEDNKLNAVYVADIDLISDWFFVQRERADADLQFDNVTFVLNAVDVLAGDKSYVSLRKRRAAHRTLSLVEERTAAFKKQRNAEEEKADEEAKEQLKARKKQFEEKVKEIEQDKSLDRQTQQIMIQNLQAAEQRRQDVAEANIERNKQKKIEDIKSKTEREIRATEDGIRYWAVIIPPIPAVILGIWVLSMRLVNERRDISPDRLVSRR